MPAFQWVCFSGTDTEGLRLGAMLVGKNSLGWKIRCWVRRAFWKPWIDLLQGEPRKVFPMVHQVLCDHLYLLYSPPWSLTDTWGSSLFPGQVTHGPASGPLHMPFPLPGTLFPQIPTWLLHCLVGSLLRHHFLSNCFSGPLFNAIISPPNTFYQFQDELCTPPHSYVEVLTLSTA